MNKKKHNLIIIAGFAGSGKTTISKILSKKYNIPGLEVDFLGKELRKIPEMKTVNPKNIYPIAYQLTYKLVEELLKDNQNLILDINMCNPMQWAGINKIKGARPLFFILKSPFEICRKRVGKRYQTNPKEHFLNKKNIKDVKNKWEYIQKKKGQNIITIDATKKTADVVRAIEKHLDSSTHSIHPACKRRGKLRASFQKCSV